MLGYTYFKQAENIYNHAFANNKHKHYYNIFIGIKTMKISKTLY